MTEANIQEIMHLIEEYCSARANFYRAQRVDSYEQMNDAHWKIEETLRLFLAGGKESA